MKLPIWLLIYLPRAVQIRSIQRRWDDKADTEVLDSFTDATEWIDISMGLFSSDTTKKIAQDCFKRLDLYVLPQMRKRGLI